jgi:hypothetical protein
VNLCGVYESGPAVPARVGGVGGTPVPTDHWLVSGLDPLTLDRDHADTLSSRPQAFAVAADGDQGYALAGRGRPPSASGLVRLDLYWGTALPLGSVPGSGSDGLAVAGDLLYVPYPEGGTVAVVDRHSGAPLRPATAGRGPIGIAIAGG